MSKLEDYTAALERLQIELVATQAWAIKQGLNVLILFEGRDAAGKDGAIKRVTEHLSQRHTRVIALPKPTERQQSQWYFQRYIPYLPADGETVLFNRSWYNRATVEPVMGFCTPEQHRAFLQDAPVFEKMLVDSGTQLIKFWLDIDKDEQAERLTARLEDPLKRFKVSPLDAEAQKRWKDYSAARDRMLAETDTHAAPWTVVATNKKKQARLNVIRHIIHRLNRPGHAIEPPDPAVVTAAKHAKLAK